MPRPRRACRPAHCATLVLVLLIAAGVLPAVAEAARTIAVQLTPSTIVADGQSTTVATATVTNGHSAPIPGDVVTFASSVPGQLVSPTTNNNNGTYSATITSTTAAGTSTITATDTTPTPDVSATAALTQVAGPAAHLTLQLSPTAIAANGSSTSVATATVTDAFNNRVIGDTIVFSASDAAIRFGPTTDNGDGTYTATLTSSTHPGIATVVATDPGTGATGAAPLTLATSASTTTLSAVPAATLTNRLVTLVAIVTASGSGSDPSGTVTFESQGRPISGCEAVPTVPQVGQLLSESVCQASFAASTPTVDLRAVFLSAAAGVADSTASASISVARGGTSTSLDISNPSVGVGSPVTFVARVGSTDSGPAVPSGLVDFLDGGTPIAACSNLPLVSGSGSPTATCRTTYNHPGAQSITARYDGDANFTGSRSPLAQPMSVHALPPRVRGTIKAFMRWTFYYGPTYTRLLQLLVQQVPIGSRVSVSCRGRGCPYAKRVNSVRAGTVCKPSTGRKCPAQPSGAINLQRDFRYSRLAVGSQVTVAITRAGWIGKYYAFEIQSRRTPSVRISCLAPGGTRPGVNC